MALGKKLHCLLSIFAGHSETVAITHSKAIGGLLHKRNVLTPNTP